MACLFADIVLSDVNQKLLLLCGILIGVVLAGFIIIMVARRYYGQTAKSQPQDTGFSLSDLRAMRDRGEITPEEYEITRARVIAKVKGTLRPPEPKENEEGDPAAP